MFSIFLVGRSFWLGHLKSSSSQKSVGPPCLMVSQTVTVMLQLFVRRLEENFVPTRCICAVRTRPDGLQSLSKVISMLPTVPYSPLHADAAKNEILLIILPPPPPPQFISSTTTKEHRFSSFTAVKQAHLPEFVALHKYAHRLSGEFLKGLLLLFGA